MRMDSSPDRFEADQQKLDSVRYDMRVSLEKHTKKYPSFYRLVCHILDSLKLIEHEKYVLFKTCPEFNIMDAFRAFDIDGKGFISQLELTTGLLQLEIHYTQAEIETFIRYFDIENTKRIKFSDFGKAFLPNNKDYSLKILTRPARNLKREKKINEMFPRQTLIQYMILWRIILR
jgi:EF-hand domain pair